MPDHPLPFQLHGLSFAPSRKNQSEVWNRLQKPISWPELGQNSFALVVSFGRCKFRLSPSLVGLILQATIGGDAEHFKVRELGDRTFKFHVTDKDVGFFILNLRSFSCDLYVLYFHL